MLTKTTEYAIRALISVQLQNWQDKRPGVVEIAKDIQAPESYIAKILQTMVKQKILSSMKGRGGGFFYERDTKEIKLFDVINIMEGPDTLRKCGLGLKNCNSDNPCSIHDNFISLREGFNNVAKSESIYSLSIKIKEGFAVLYN